MNLQIEISNERELDMCLEKLSKYFKNDVQREKIVKYPTRISLHKYLSEWEINNNTLSEITHYTYIHATFCEFWNDYLDYLNKPIKI